MTVEASTFAPTAALIAAGLLVYFHTSSFAAEYGPKIEKIRVVLLGMMLEGTSRGDEESIKGSGVNPYFPEAGYDEIVIKSLVVSQKADDYRRCVGMVARGNELLRLMGIGLILLGLGLFPFFALLPEPVSWLVLALLSPVPVLVIVWFTKFHRLVRSIDTMDASAHLGSMDVPWRR